jgi:hypothetical protein
MLVLPIASETAAVKVCKTLNPVARLSSYTEPLPFVPNWPATPYSAVPVNTSGACGRPPSRLVLVTLL